MKYYNIHHVWWPHCVTLTSLSMSMIISHIWPYMFGHVGSNILVTPVKGISRRLDVDECHCGCRQGSSTESSKSLLVSRLDSNSFAVEPWYGSGQFNFIVSKKFTALHPQSNSKLLSYISVNTQDNTLKKNNTINKQQCNCLKYICNK